MRSVRKEASRMPMQPLEVASELRCGCHAPRKLCDGDAGAERNDAWLLAVGRGERFDRDARPDAVHREPRRWVAGGGAHDPLDPHVVGRELGELILELLDVDRALDG